VMQDFDTDLLVDPFWSKSFVFKKKKFNFYFTEDGWSQLQRRTG